MVCEIAYLFIRLHSDCNKCILGFDCLMSKTISLYCLFVCFRSIFHFKNTFKKPPENTGYFSSMKLNRNNIIKMKDKAPVLES